MSGSGVLGPHSSEQMKRAARREITNGAPTITVHTERTIGDGHGTRSEITQMRRTETREAKGNVTD